MQKYIKKMKKQKENIVEFAEKFVNIYNPYKGEYEKIKLFDYQKKLLKSFEKNRFSIVKHSRQVGIDTVASIYTSNFLIKNKDKTVLVICESGRSAEEFLEKVKEIILSIEIDPFKIKNKNKLQLKNGSRIISEAPGADSGRGFQIDLLLINNVEFIEHIYGVWAASSLSLTATKGKAILISTPRFKKDFFHKIWTDAVKNLNEFKPISINWKQNPNFNDEWYKKSCSILGNPDSIATELDCKFIAKKDKSKKSSINLRVENAKKDEILKKMKQKNISSITYYIMELIDKDLKC